MKTPQDVILAPVITERSMQGVAAKKYTFKVAKDATKIDIARAVEALFGKDNHVAKVNTMNVRGVARRLNMRMPMGHKSSWKKAVVTLTPESKGIEFFESMQ